MTAPPIDHASAAAVVTAAKRCRQVLAERLATDPDQPLAEDIRTLMAAAEAIAEEYERRTE